MAQKRKRGAQDVSAVTPKPYKQQKTTIPVSVKPAPTPLDASPFVTDPRGPDLQREVKLYDILASENAEERIAAASAIISGLLGGEGVEEATLRKHLERRLCRGLASGRKGARLGYGMVLTDILGQLFGEKDLAGTKYTGLTFDNLVDILVAKTKPDGDLDGQEKKDHTFGLLFGLESFVGAKILSGHHDRWNLILSKLLELATKKASLTREPCGRIIDQALEHLSQAQAENTLEALCGAGLALSPEGVGIWLTARTRFPDMKFPSKPWGQSGNPLDHLKSLGMALKESDEESQKIKQATQTGSWTAKLHFVWDSVLAEYAVALEAQKDGIKSQFENFWKVAVDENLFAATASNERKYWGFLLFQKVLDHAEIYDEVLPSVFSQNLYRCLINQLQSEDRFLHRAAEKSLRVLLTAVEDHPDLLTIVLPHLIGGNGTYNFDRVTKTKSIERLLKLIDDDNAEDIIEILIEPALSVETAAGTDLMKESEMRRTLLGDHLLNIIRKVNILDDTRTTSWIKDTALPAIAKIAYGTPLCHPPLSEKTRNLFRNRLASAFAHLLSDLTGFSFPCDLALSIVPDAVVMDEGIKGIQESALTTMGKILKKTKKAEKPAALQALALLYSLSLFQLYNGEADAASAFDELKLCYDTLVRHRSSKDQIDVDASEVLVELLLSFLSQPSALLRKVSKHVFGAFMTDMTAGGLKLMTDVLESSESLKGQQEMFDQEPEDGDAVNEDGDDPDTGMDSDVEIVDMDADEGKLNAHLADRNEDEGEDDDDDADEEDEEAKKLDAALAQALRTHRLDQDAGAESDSDVDMTDSEMMAMDAKLEEIFKQRKKTPNKKQEQKDAKENMVNFKTRVLDLLGIFVKKQASNSLAFDLLLPLVQLIRTTKAKQLGIKAHGIIASFAKASKGSNGISEDEIDCSGLFRTLKAIHDEASKDPSHSFAKAVSSASILVSSRLFRADKGHCKKIMKIYADSETKCMLGKVRIQASFFHDKVNWVHSHTSA